MSKGTVKSTLFRDHRDSPKNILAARGLIAIGVVAALVFLLVSIGRGAFVDTVNVEVLVDDAGGSLVKGGDVKYDGVTVGEVTTLEAAADGDPAKSGVRLKVKLDEAFADEVPANVKARILPASVFGISFVDLVPAGRPSGKIRAGQEIPQDASMETLEMQTILDGLDRVIGSLGPARISRMLNAISSTLDGNGEKLGQTIERLEAYLRKLNPTMPLVRRNVELLATNLDSFQQNAPELFQATEDAMVVTTTLIEQEQNFQKLLTGGQDALSQTQQTLTASEKSLVQALMQTAVVVDTFYDGRQGLVDGINAVMKLAVQMGGAIGANPYAKVDINVKLDGWRKYTESDCPAYGSYQGRNC